MKWLGSIFHFLYSWLLCCGCDRKRKSASEPLRLRILVIGGSFGGLAVCRKLSGVSGIDVTVVEPKEFVEYTPGILKAIVKPSEGARLRVPLRTAVPASMTILRGTVTQLDVLSAPAQHRRGRGSEDSEELASSLAAEGLVGSRGHGLAVIRPIGASTTSTGRVQTIEHVFDLCVIATGSSYAAPCKAGPAALTERDRDGELLRTFQTLQVAGHVTVVGGGAVGVELAAELVEYFQEREAASAAVPRSYDDGGGNKKGSCSGCMYSFASFLPRCFARLLCCIASLGGCSKRKRDAAMKHTTVTLISSAPTLLHGAPAALSSAAQAWFQSRNSINAVKECAHHSEGTSANTLGGGGGGSGSPRAVELIMGEKVVSDEPIEADDVEGGCSPSSSASFSPAATATARRGSGLSYSASSVTTLSGDDDTVAARLKNRRKASKGADGVTRNFSGSQSSSPWSTKRKVLLSNGTSILTDCVFYCTGIVPQTQFLLASSPSWLSSARRQRDGRIEVDHTLRIVQRASNSSQSEVGAAALPVVSLFPAIFALGDAAAIVGPSCGAAGSEPALAHTAEKHAECVSHSIKNIAEDFVRRQERIAAAAASGKTGEGQGSSIDLIDREPAHPLLASYPSSLTWGLSSSPLIMCITLGHASALLRFNSLLLYDTWVGQRVSAFVKLIIEYTKLMELANNPIGIYFWVLADGISNVLMHRIS